MVSSAYINDIYINKDITSGLMLESTWYALDW